MQKKITIYCASSKNVADIYLQSAFSLGEKIANSNCEIIYGGGNVGLMGCLADGALGSGGLITGIIPDFLKNLELGHTGITKLITVSGLHERQNIMMESADIIMALPGGCGTFLEIMEAITWKKLGRIDCPIIIINVNNYFDEFIKTLQKAIDEGFMRKDHIALWTVVDDVDTAVRFLHNNIEFVHYDIV